MKELEGWQCSECHAIILQFRNKRPPFCPHCKNAGHGCEERSKLLDPPFVVVRMDNADVGGKPRAGKRQHGSIPGQQPLPLPEPTPASTAVAQTEDGGLF